MISVRDIHDGAAGPRDQRGLTLMEVVVLLTAVTLLVGALVPATVRQIQESRIRDALDEMQTLHQAIVGGEAGSTFGFVGDIGRMPTELYELGEAGPLPLYESSEATGIGAGWNGPYVNAGIDAMDFLLDPWGREYDIGVVGFGQIRSAGPNGLYNDDDDLVVPPAPEVVYGELVVQVVGHSGTVETANPEGCTVNLEYSENGQASVVDDLTAPFSFSGVHRGLHAVHAHCPRADVDDLGIATRLVAVTGGGAQQLVEIHVDLGETLERLHGAIETDDEDATTSNGSESRDAARPAGGR